MIRLVGTVLWIIDRFMTADVIIDEFSRIIRVDKKKRKTCGIASMSTIILLICLDLDLYYILVSNTDTSTFSYDLICLYSSCSCISFTNYTLVLTVYLLYYWCIDTDSYPTEEMEESRTF